MAGGNPPSGPSRPRRPQQQPQQQRKPLQAMGSKELLKRQSATDLGAAKVVVKKRSRNAVAATEGVATGGNATALGPGARPTKPVQPSRPTLHRAPSNLNPSALSFQPSPTIPAAAEVPCPEPTASSPPAVTSETLPRRREQSAPTASARRIVSGPAVIPGVGNHASSSASSSTRSRHVSRLSHPTNTFPHRPAGLPEKPTLAMKIADVPEAPLLVGRMSSARPQPSPGPTAATIPTLPPAKWPECPVVPAAPLSLPASFANAPPAAKADEDDLTPKTRRRVAGQGLKKAMSEAALRRKRTAPPPGGRLPSLAGVSNSRSRVASDPHSTPVSRNKRSQLTPARVDEGEKENAPPGPLSPATPSPLPPSSLAIEALPPAPAFDGDEEFPGSPPSPAALLLSASFTSWPLAAPAPIRKAKFAEPAVAAHPVPTPAPLEPEIEPSVESVPIAAVDEVEVEEEKASKRNSYVPRPLLLPSKLARNASSSSTIVIRSPKSSSASTTTTAPGSAAVRSESLPRGSSVGGLTFSAFAEAGTRPARPASLILNAGGAVSVGPGGRQFAPSAHSRASSAGSVSPPMSPTLVATSPRLRTLREEGPHSTEEPGVEGHSRTVSVGKGRRRERPMSTSSNVGLGLRLEQAFAAAAVGDDEKVRRTLRSGNGHGIDDDGSGRGPEEASLLPSPFVATGSDTTPPTAPTAADEASSPKKSKKRAAAPGEHKGKLPAAAAARRANRNAMVTASAPKEEGYSSLQDLLEREGVQHTRVVTPVRKAVVDVTASPPKRPIIEAVAVKHRSSLMDIFTAVKDVLLPPPSSVALCPPEASESLPVSSPPQQRNGHRTTSSSSTVSSFGAPLNGKSAELVAAEEAVRGRIAGWVQQTQESLLDDLRPTVVLPGQKVPSTPAAASRVPRVERFDSPIRPFAPDAAEGDDRPFRVGSPPPVSAPPALAAGVTMKPAVRAKHATPTLVKRATARSLMRKPSRPVLTAGHVKAPALVAATTMTPSPLSRDDDFVLIHNLDEHDAVATFENVESPPLPLRQARAKSQLRDFFDTPPSLASTSSAPRLSTTPHKGVRRQVSVEGLARAKLGKLLEEEEERWIKRKKSLGALAYGPPPRIVIWESP